MTKIDIISGFLGAGKTTLIKKLLKEALQGEKVVLIENEFGEIGVDGGFLKEAGIEIKEMNSGCICCSLVGDFGTSLKEVLETYHPERIVIEPSGVGKLSDVAAAVNKVDFEEGVVVNSMAAVVDASKCKLYMKNFGEFFLNQIENSGTIILSRTGKMTEEKLNTTVELIRKHNKEAVIITTDWDKLEGKAILSAMEKVHDMEKELLEEAVAGHKQHESCGCEGEHGHHHKQHESCGCEGEHGHHHKHHEGCGCGAEDGHHQEQHESCDCGGEHGHHHHHHEGCGCEGEHGHHHKQHESCGCEGEHGHHHEHHEGCDCGGEHGHHHEHHEGCGCGQEHSHGHHHAEEVFSSWGRETPVAFTVEGIRDALEALEDEKSFGFVLRAKGIVADKESEEWIYFDYVPGEVSVRHGKPEVTGKICVIGSKMKEGKLGELFGI